MEPSSLPSGLNPSKVILTACFRCRHQKQRCSKGKPKCTRCTSLGTHCAYPPPPNRARSATLRGGRPTSRSTAPRTPSAISRSYSGTVSSTSQQPVQWMLQDDQIASAVVGRVQTDSPNGISGPSNPQFLVDVSPSNRLIHQTANTSAFPRSEVAMFLIEVYFSRVYNASLLFHKPRFLSEWSAGEVPDYIQLSIFALASIFLQGTELSEHPHFLPQTHRDWTSVGNEWATLASRNVLAEADVPRIATVQACQNLALYWFASGQTDRTNFHTSIAYRTCRLLGLHHNPNEVEKGDSVTQELNRRCLWSCWMTQCISQDNAIFRSSNWIDIAEIPLPCAESSFLKGIPVLTEFFDASGELHALDVASDKQTESSIMGNLAKLVGIWWEIQSTFRTFSKLPPGEFRACLPALFSLQKRLEDYDERLPLQLRYSTDLSVNSSQDYEKIFSLNALYHLCVCLLHAPIVPFFGSSKRQIPLSNRMMQDFAKEVVSHSSKVLEMSESFLDQRPDISKVPSLTGYCMFVCITLQEKYATISGNSEGVGVQSRAASVILTTLKEFWKPLNPLVMQLRQRFKIITSPLSMTVLEADLSKRQPIGRDVEETLPDVLPYVVDADLDSSTVRPLPATHVSEKDLRDKEVRSTEPRRRQSVIGSGENAESEAPTQSSTNNLSQGDTQATTARYASGDPVNTFENTGFWWNQEPGGLRTDEIIPFDSYFHSMVPF